MAEKIENAVIWSNARFGLFCGAIACMVFGRAFLP